MISMHTSPAASPGRGDAGGMNVAVVALAEQLSARGIEVDLLTRAIDSTHPRELSAGVTLRPLLAGAIAPLPKSQLPIVADEFGEAVATLVRARDREYDVLHAHYWLSGLATLPVAIETGVPFVQSFHTLAAMKNRALADGDTPEPEARLRSEAFIAAQADAIVAGSSSEVEAVIDELRAPADRLWVIPPGVDTALFTPARRRNDGEVRSALGLESDRPLLVVAARIQPLKDLELAVRTLAGVRALRGSAPPLLVVAGEATDEQYLASLGAVASALGVARDVRYVGALDRETLADLFAAADVTLVTSHSETFGLVALESASSGTPVVAYRGTGLVESVSDGESGILIDSRDPGRWAGVVAALLADDAARARLGASARRFAEGFTWATAGASLLGVYESLAEARRR